VPFESSLIAIAVRIRRGESTIIPMKERIMSNVLLMIRPHPSNEVGFILMIGIPRKVSTSMFVWYIERMSGTKWYSICVSLQNSNISEACVLERSDLVWRISSILCFLTMSLRFLILPRFLIERFSGCLSAINPTIWYFRLHSICLARVLVMLLLPIKRSFLFPIPALSKKWSMIRIIPLPRPTKMAVSIHA